MSSDKSARTGCLDCPKRLHLILYGPGRDRNTFHNAATLLERDYKRHYPVSKYQNEETKVLGFSDGDDLVEKINMQEDNTIISLDIISHGNQAGVHVSETLDPPEPSYWAKRNAHMKIRGKSKEEAAYMEEEMKGFYSGKTGAIGVSYYFNQKLFKNESTWGRIEGKMNSENMVDGVSFLSEIESDKFMSDAFIEFHGCRVAEYQPWLNDLTDNFAENFAEHIGNNCTVVGHIDNNFPNNHPVNSNDYRHNKVRIYGNTAWWRFGDAEQSDAQERWGLEFPNSSTPPGSY